jgi:hypothetical protein
MNQRYLTGLAAGTLGLMLAATPAAEAVPPVPADVFYGSINPTFDGGDHYLLFTIGVTDAAGSFVTFANYVFTDTNPDGLQSGDLLNTPVIVGSGTTDYITYNPDFSFANQPASPHLAYGVQSFLSVKGPVAPTGLAQGNFAYTPSAVANYPDVLTFTIGNPITGALSIQQNNPFVIPSGVPEIDPGSSALPLMMVLGGLAVAERRRRRPTEEWADEE